jgi:uroporphyrinogen III methyltransferase/synthase
VRSGIVYLVGAGPGAPGLLTLRGRDCLQRADVVLYDYLANPELLIHAPVDAEKIFAGKHGQGPHVLEQGDINDLLIQRAGEGLCVVRLKGGDPMVFGRGAEEAEILRAAGVRFEIVPGVTSALAVPSLAGIPVTHRDWVSGVTILTGHDAADKKETRIRWASVAQAGNTIVILMGLTQMRRNLEALETEGLAPETPAAAIQWGGSPSQRTVIGTLHDLADQVAALEMRPPVTVVIGEVVRLRESVEWFESRPLFGRRIVVTRPRHQAPRLASLLTEQGAEVLECPTIEITPLDATPLRQEIQHLDSYDLLIFTSANGVDQFFRILQEEGLDARSLAGLRLAAIGPQTARSLADRQLLVDVLPTEFRAEGILDSLGTDSLAGCRVLLPRAEGARAILPDTLRERGAAVTEVLTYRSVAPADGVAAWEAIVAGGIPDCVTFTSSSTFTSFLGILDQARGGRSVLDTMKLACIGPITARTIRDAGWDVDIEANPFTIPDLAAAITAKL